jgi:mono/diheme cytochrome c family protein
MQARFAALIALSLAAASPGSAQAADARARGPAAWSGCCDLAPWPQAREMPTRRDAGGGWVYRGYSHVVAGSALRHHLAERGEIPAPYATLHNPLPPTPANVRRGASIYMTACASCHGPSGLGDGPASAGLKPRPAGLSWITKLPANRWDAFMYWSIAEGAARFGTDMPMYKGKLTSAEMWSVIGYIQARLPKPQAARP